jgi:hypothetical protein
MRGRRFPPLTIPASPYAVVSDITPAELLRRAYFARAGALGLRYHVDAERLIEHVQDAPTITPSLLGYVINQLDDVVHAIGCIDDIAVAWSDLAERHEPYLLRACRTRLDAPEAIVHVRRLLARVRASTIDPDRGESPSLRTYRGTQPLRAWLIDKTMRSLRRTRRRTHLRLTGPLEPQPICALAGLGPAAATATPIRLTT